MIASAAPRRLSARSNSWRSSDGTAGDDARHVEELLDQVRLPRRVVEDRLQRTVVAARLERSAPQHGRPPEHRIERRPQLVRHRGEELVLRPVRGLGVRPRALGRFVETRAIERLRAVLRHRRQQRPVLVDEVHRRGEVKRQHAQDGASADSGSTAADA